MRLFLTAMASLFLLIAVSGLFAGPDGTDTPTLHQRLIVAPLAALALWITLGIFRQGVWSGPDRIVVRNVFRRYEVSWSDVKDIEHPPPYGKVGNAGLQIVLTDGGRTEIETDRRGFIRTGRDIQGDPDRAMAAQPFETAMRGVFAVGDVRAASVHDALRVAHPHVLATHAQPDQHVEAGDRRGAGAGDRDLHRADVLDRKSVV